MPTPVVKMPKLPGPNRRVRGPKMWCHPPSAFGKLEQATRVWLRPSGNDPLEVAQFRAAVMQNAIAVHVRAHKNLKVLRRRGLAELDNRLDAEDLWNARLNGHEHLTTADIATLLTVLPDSLPDWQFIGVFLAVAAGETPPDDWGYKDTCA